MPDRKHSIRCECAHPKSRCRCSCRGALHGIARVNADTNIGEKALTKDAGGEVAAFIEEYAGEEYECTCGAPVVVGMALMGYPHEGGLADSAGKRWWLYSRCEKCEYEMSFWKIKGRLKGLRNG